jgi:hypothetical protein
VYLLGFQPYINEMHGSRSKIPIKKISSIYIYIYVKLLDLLRAPYVHDISRLTVKQGIFYFYFTSCFHEADNIKAQLRGRDHPSATLVFKLPERMSVKFDTEGLKLTQFWFLVLLHTTLVSHPNALVEPVLHSEHNRRLKRRWTFDMTK